MQFDGDDTAKIGGAINRLREPSTMAGVAMLLSLIGVQGDTLTMTETVMAAVAGVFSLLAVVVPERGRGK